MSKARDYHHGNLKEKLLDAALSLLDEGGEKSIGIRQIAKATDVAHSAPANHFKNKRSLLVALNARIVSHFIETVKRRFKQEGTPEEPIKHFSTIVLEYGLEYPNRYRLVWQSEFPLSEAMEEVYTLLTNMLQPHADRKHVDVESQAIAVWSLIHGYVALRLDGHLDIGQDDVTGLNRQLAIIDVILDGIKTSASKV